MKVCTKCNREKPIINFAYKNKSKKIWQSWCKDCQRIYNQLHYQTNSTQHKANVASRKQRIKAYVDEYLMGQSCVDCGNNDYRVLEFDHVSGTKISAVKTMVYNGLSVKTINKEIAKCEIRCANCHRIRHWEQRNNAL